MFPQGSCASGTGLPRSLSQICEPSEASIANTAFCSVATIRAGRLPGPSVT
jgi:hypothetical protein